MPGIRAARAHDESIRGVSTKMAQLLRDGIDLSINGVITRMTNGTRHESRGIRTQRAGKTDLVHDFPSNAVGDGRTINGNRKRASQNACAKLHAASA